MKIGIVGNYGNDNNGDEAILLSIIRQLQKVFQIDTQNITVFSNNPTQTAERYSVQSAPLYYKNGNAVKTFAKTYKENSKVVKNLDFVVIGGGGILMDLYKREAPLYGSYAMMAHNNNVPYVVYGCGAGPLNTGLGKWFIRYMAKHAQNISVRDPQSQALLKSIGVKRDVPVIGDPAFSLEVERSNYNEKPKSVGVTAVPYYNASYWPTGDEAKYENYIDGMAKNLDRLIEEQQVEVTFFATKYPQDADVTKNIQAKMKHAQNTKIIDENLPPQRILDLTATFDVLIGTRLHSLILATDAKTPIIGVSYHVKVNDFLQMAGLGNYSLPIEELHKSDDKFAMLFNDMALDWNGAQKLAARTNASFKEKSALGERLLKEGAKRS
ncbi:polysaccharide pyruvyl transferase family protein [Solibacillus sp. A46]|uniref:Polysaccharide pyruvyl transferase family protein n=1 Tax=Solibacillus faecavium TaxID=2762221 RepID=A0ABR8XUW5_9BACL|nr:polysaccharide pyruvyl transferase family protein [Solibacillus faecavium]MBD8035741.1 polysaccharide pyruvyl transferase family protein [Solibacillus faecavium]